MALPVLWHFTVSHFNEKARWALDFKRVRHVRRALLPGSHFLKIWRMTGQTAVPVLALDGRPIHDSTRIIEALERAYPEPPLYPRNEPERRRELEPSGYLVGDGFSVADLTAAALFYPLVQPPEFPYPWPRPLPAWLGEYRAALAGRAAFQWVGEMYSRHRGTSAEVVA